MTIYFKRRGIWVQLGTFVFKQTQILKFDFFVSDCNQVHYQIGFMSEFVHTICNSSYWYHTEAS